MKMSTRRSLPLLTLSSLLFLSAAWSEPSSLQLSLPSHVQVRKASQVKTPVLLCLDPEVVADVAQGRRDLSQCGVGLALLPLDSDCSPQQAEKELLQATSGFNPQITWLCTTARQVQQAPANAQILFVPRSSLERLDQEGPWKQMQILVASDSVTEQVWNSALQQPSATWKKTSLLALDRLDRGDLSRSNSPLQSAIRRTIVEWNPTPTTGVAGARWVKSPNWGVRPVGEVVDTVVVHSTVINTMEGTIRAFQDDKVRRVSAHYCIDRDGSIVQMVDENLTAWHAGVSELEGKPGVNGFSIGIELINLNDGKDPYPEAQMQALSKVIRDIRTRWDVPESRIVSHALIARPPGRKSDPLGFDFDHLFRLLR